MDSRLVALHIKGRLTGKQLAIPWNLLTLGGPVSSSFLRFAKPQDVKAASNIENEKQD